MGHNEIRLQVGVPWIAENFLSELKDFIIDKILLSQFRGDSVSSTSPWFGPLDGRNILTQLSRSSSM